MAKLNAVQEELFAWYDKIHEAHDAMPEEERQELAEWERPHLGRCGYDGTLLGSVPVTCEPPRKRRKNKRVFAPITRYRDTTEFQAARRERPDEGTHMRAQRMVAPREADAARACWQGVVVCLCASQLGCT